ncbi:hypothetical protein PoB_004700400 [Plakobranchus ocellatus]|uniref:Uncharacterized protein n=1 Tax=Plakobranchus ocellatus TaxID=259542 RepID=A0AAV4BNS2_9GAST|nr:hypothetical protein PoB_004700400 [Plakobranchus ocellatus]
MNFLGRICGHGALNVQPSVEKLQVVRDGEIRARMKNHVEEVKLQKVLANLEVGRRIKKIMLNMELYEDRKTAHKLKKEVSDLETKKKKAMHKFISNRGRANFNSFAAKTGFFPLKRIDIKNSTTHSLTEPTRDAVTTAPPSGVNRTAIFPITKGTTRNTSPNNCSTAPAAAHSADMATAHNTAATTATTTTNNHQSLNESFNGKSVGAANGNNQNFHVIISLNNANNSSARMRRRSNSFRETAVVTAGALGNQRRDHSPMHHHHQNHAPHSSGPPNRRPEHCSLQQPMVYRRASGVPHMPPTSLSLSMHASSRLGAFDFDTASPAGGATTPATIPMHRLKRTATDLRSVHTLPNLPAPSSSTTITMAARPKTSGSSKLWPGDPNAIQSVRRERKKPEEMLSLVKNGEEARRMIRDTPITCSRNCSKPDLLIELGRSYSDLPSLLPAIEKARHDLARREAASRDAVPHADHFLEEVAEPMPVSQIHYGALRSLGGIRRNSVIV